MVVLVIKLKASTFILKLDVKDYMVIISVKLVINYPVSYSLVVINDFSYSCYKDDFSYSCY